MALNSQVLVDVLGNGLTSTLVSSKQALDVNVVNNSNVADGATFTAGSSIFTALGGVFDDTPVAALASGKQGAARLTANRALHINLRTAAGAELGATQAAGLQVIIGDGTNTPAVKAASTAPVAADKSLVVAISPNSTFLGTVAPGVAATQSVLEGGIYNSTPPTLTNGQQASIQLDANGNQKVAIVGSISVTAAADTSAVATTPTAASQTMVAATNKLLLASNAAREQVFIQNLTGAVIYLGFGAAASLTNFNAIVNPGATFEFTKNVYTGDINAFSVLGGNARATEFTA